MAAKRNETREINKHNLYSNFKRACVMRRLSLLTFTTIPGYKLYEKDNTHTYSCNTLHIHCCYIRTKEKNEQEEKIEY